MAKKRKRAVEQTLVGRLVIHRAADMSKQGRRRVAAWLTRVGRDVVKQGDNYSARFTAKYWWR